MRTTAEPWLLPGSKQGFYRRNMWTCSRWGSFTPAKKQDSKYLKLTLCEREMKYENRLHRKQRGRDVYVHLWHACLVKVTISGWCTSVLLKFWCLSTLLELAIIITLLLWIISICKHRAGKMCYCSTKYFIVSFWTRQDVYLI